MILDLCYSNDRTNVIISVFEGIGDYPYTTKIRVEGTTIKENRFETKEEALRDFMWLVSSDIMSEEKV
jgi:hypothetical protein